MQLELACANYKHEKTLKDVFIFRRKCYGKGHSVKGGVLYERHTVSILTCMLYNSKLYIYTLRKQFFWTHSVCFHNSSFWKTPIFDPLTDPTVESFIAIHPPTVDWALLLDPIYRMAQDVKTYGLDKESLCNV